MFRPLAAAAAGVLALSLTASAEEPAGTPKPWSSLWGSGLLTVPDTRTLAPGRVSAALTVNNRDRDPLGLDLLDGALTAAAGVGRSTEVHVEWVVSRVVALPEAPAAPPPPLDLLVLPGAAAPEGALYSLHWPVPYVDKRGSDRFDDFVPGGLRLGVKHRFSEGAGARPSLAGTFDLTVPLTRRRADLRSGSGTGGVDAALGGVAEWTRGRTALVTSLAYTRVGAPPDGDRWITRAADGRANVIDRPLDVPDRFETGLGLRHELTRSVAAVGEVVGTWDVGARTPVIDSRSPLDVLGGFQFRWGGARLSLALRYHGRSLPSGAERRPPLAGWIDVTDVEDAALDAYLAARGAGSLADALRPDAQRVLSPDPAARPLPAGARVIPESYGVRSEHQVGFLFLWGWVF